MRSDEEKREVELGVPEKSFFPELPDEEQFDPDCARLGRAMFDLDMAEVDREREEEKKLADKAMAEIHVEQAREAQRHLVRSIQDLLSALHLGAGLARTQQFASPVNGDLWNRFGGIADGVIAVIAEGEELLRVVRGEEQAGAEAPAGEAPRGE